VRQNYGTVNQNSGRHSSNVNLNAFVETGDVIRRNTNLEDLSREELIAQLRMAQQQQPNGNENNNGNQQPVDQNNIRRQWTNAMLDNFILLLSDLGFQNTEFFSPSRLTTRDANKIKRVTEESMQRFMNNIVEPIARELCFG